MTGTKTVMAMALDIGRLRHRIELLRYEVYQDPRSGAIKEDWVPVAKRWATVEPVRGQERWAAQQVQAEVTHRIYMRYMPGVTPDMKIRFRGREFDIYFVRNIDERNEMLEILATERVNV